MSKVIIAGHGGYGTAIKNTLAMLVGETPGMYYVDFNMTDDLAILDGKLKAAINECKDDDILFICDLSGGSPFRQSAMLCLEHPTYIALAGLNVAACAEAVFNLDMEIGELAEMLIEVSKTTVMRFPQIES